MSTTLPWSWTELSWHVHVYMACTYLEYRVYMYTCICMHGIEQHVHTTMSISSLVPRLSTLLSITFELHAFEVSCVCFSQGPVMVASQYGGVNIEEIAKTNPTAIFKEPVDITQGTSCIM